MNEEDDLPVLTQVLVTASGRAASATGAHESDVEQPPQRRLVIGSDPDDDEVDVGTPDPVADPRRPTLGDIFSPTVPNGAERRLAAAPRREAPRSGGSSANPEHPWFLDEPHIDRDAIGRSMPSARTGADDAHGAEAVGTANLPMAGSFTERPLLFPAEPADVVARAIRDDVLDRLAASIDTALDARMAQAIRIELDAAIAHLQTRLRVELSEALRDVVGRAVDEAIARRGPAGGPGDAGRA